MSVIFICPMAYDYIDNQKKTGRGTITRINALLKKIREDRNNIYIFVSTAGFTAKSPKKATEGVTTSLADQMYEHIKDIKDISYSYRYPCAFGTYNEILANIKIIKSLTNNTEKTIWIGTNWIHIPRVWLCTRFLAPKNFKVKFISCHHPFGGVKEYLKEICKFFIYLKRFVFKEWPS